MKQETSSKGAQLSWLAKRTLPDDLKERVRTFPFNDTGHGYDAFGMSRRGVAAGLLLFKKLYENYFRVVSHGHENLPKAGPAVLACNHSGSLPFDGMMVWTDIVRRSNPVRVPRVVMDHFVSLMPFVGLIYIRGGCIGGSRANFHSVLSGGEMILVFPEGVPGVGKRFSERYQLQTWREGHVELAMRHGAPVIPTAVVGAEEQMPQIGRIPGFHVFGAPYLPVTLTPFPLPVRYHIYYGEPIPIGERYGPESANDPHALAEASAEVRDAVQALITKGLNDRKGVFR